MAELAMPELDEIHWNMKSSKNIVNYTISDITFVVYAFEAVINGKPRWAGYRKAVSGIQNRQR